MRKEACRLTPSDFHRRTLVVVTMDAQLGGTVKDSRSSRKSVAYRASAVAITARGAGLVRHVRVPLLHDPIREPYRKRRASLPRRRWRMGRLVVLILLGILLIKGSLEIGIGYA